MQLNDFNPYYFTKRLITSNNKNAEKIGSDIVKKYNS